MPCSLRDVAPADAPALAALSGALGYPSRTESVARRLDRLRHTPGNHVVVAEAESGEVVGWVHVFAAHRVESDSFAEIGGLVVGERVRGGGIGRRLVEAAEAWARAEGLHQVRVRSNVVRETAHAFYERLGYDLAKTQRVFVKALAGG